MSVPRGFGPPKREEYLGHIRAGLMRGKAAEMMGFKRKTILDWIEGNPEFAELVEDAERERNEHVDEAIFHAAISGSVQAAKLWWERLGLMPEKRGRPPSTAPPDMPSPTRPDEDDEEDALYNVTPLRRRE
jgi:hypothetical protein